MIKETACPLGTEHLKVELLDRVLVLTLNRPDRLNALSREMIEAGIPACAPRSRTERRRRHADRRGPRVLRRR